MLKGGSAGQREDDNVSGGSKYGSFFKDGVQSFALTIKTPIKVRFLPAFDYSLTREDEAFKTSVLSYRTGNLDDETDPLTDTEGFSSWFFTVKGYTFFGNDQKKFLSGYTLGEPYYETGIDPIRDTYVYISKSLTHFPASVKELVDKKEEVDGKLVSKKTYLQKTPREFALANVLLFNPEENTWENKILEFTSASLNHLKRTLCVKAGRDDEVITPEWDKYLFGDITHPKCGSIANTKKTKIENYETACFYFSKNNQDLIGREALPVTDEQLAKRWDIADTDNVTHISPYQELLDYLVADGEVPLEILEAACGKYGKIDKSLRSTPVVISESKSESAPAPETKNVHNTISEANKAAEKSGEEDFDEVKPEDLDSDEDTSATSSDAERLEKLQDLVKDPEFMQKKPDEVLRVFSEISQLSEKLKS